MQNMDLTDLPVFLQSFLVYNNLSATPAPKVTTRYGPPRDLGVSHKVISTPKTVNDEEDLEEDLELLMMKRTWNC